MSRLDEIEKRVQLGVVRQVGEHRNDWDRHWLLSNARNALDYIDRVSTDRDNAWVSMTLGRLRDILEGRDDGRTISETGNNG